MSCFTIILHSNEIDQAAAQDILYEFVICSLCASNSRYWRTKVLVRFKSRKFFNSSVTGEKLTENESKVKINEPSLDNASSSSSGGEYEPPAKQIELNKGQIPQSSDTQARGLVSGHEMVVDVDDFTQLFVIMMKTMLIFWRMAKMVPYG